MSITLQTFTARELLTAAKLNSNNSAITAKFNGGITQADMAWPFPVGGNIDMRWFGLLNIPRFWKWYNINDRDSTSTTVADVYAAVSAEGGGVILIPPDTSVSLNNITVGASIATVGANWTSVVTATSANNPTFACTAGAADIWFMNVKMDGSAAVGASTCAVKAQSSSRLKIHDVWFKDWATNAVVLTNNGTPGLATTDSEIVGGKFDNAGLGASGAMISIVDVDGLMISDVWFNEAHGGCVVAEIASNTQLAKDITLSTCHFKQTSAQITKASVYFDKTSSTLSDSQGGLKILNCDFDGNSEDSRTCIDIQDWQDFRITDCALHDCTSNLPAVRTRNCKNFTVDVDIFDWTGGDGIVLGSEGYAQTTFASRTESACTDWDCAARMRNIGKAGVILVGGSKRYNLHDVVINDCSQATDNTYFGIEYWTASATMDTDGGSITNCASRNIDAVAPLQKGGLETYTGLGNGGGATNANISGTSASNLRVVGNHLPGMAAAGADFANDGTNSIRYIANQ